MKITDTTKNLCKAISEIKAANCLKDDEWAIESYFEYDYEHNVEIEVRSKLIDSRVVFTLDKDYCLVSYEVKGRDKSIEVYRKLLQVIVYMEKTFYGIKERMKCEIKKMESENGIPNNRRLLHVANTVATNQFANDMALDD